MPVLHELPPHGAVAFPRYCLLEGRIAAWLAGLFGGCGLAVSLWFWQLARVPDHETARMAQGLLFGFVFVSLATLAVLFLTFALCGWRRLRRLEWIAMISGAVCLGFASTLGT